MIAVRFRAAICISVYHTQQRMSMRNKKVELLAPAGNAEAFYGAVHAGADAIYLGGNRFGARAYAENFSEDELVDCIRYAHLLGRKVYLTVNTLVKESEFSELYEYLMPYYRAGLDGVIIQDMGVFAFIRDAFPQMELHGSTQMTITGEYGAEFLKKQGACRVVPARELSLEEIRRIKEVTGMEIECFIHGAMCYCYSGQCLFSSILGGRSGNRGRCAQPCRLPYTVGGNRRECYPLSLKDMCTIENIPELIDAGIDSFKIEGRMKKPEYAAGVTAVYRKYIDKYYEKPGEKIFISGEDLHRLSCLYIRSERQNGYYHKHNGKEMVTLNNPAYSGSDEQVLEQIREKYLYKHLTLPVQMKASFLTGTVAKLTLRCDQTEVTVTGETVQKAAKQPITVENISKQLGKLGGSNFHLDGTMDIRVSENAFYPLKTMNELRRKGLSLLEQKLITANGFPYTREVQKPFDITGAHNGHMQKQSGFSLYLRTAEQWNGFLRSSFLKKPKEHTSLRIYVDSDLFLTWGDTIAEHLQILKKISAETVLALPKIIRLRDSRYLKLLEKSIRDNLEAVDGFLISSLEHVGLLQQWDFLQSKKRYGDHGLYLWNCRSIEFWTDYLDGFCLPLELNYAEQRQIVNGILPAEKFLYGRIPMMVTANCVTKTTDHCRREEGFGITELTDRYHKVFPVMRNCTHCYNIIYNSVPFSLHKTVAKWKDSFCCRLEFTTESENETWNVLEYFYGSRTDLPYTEYTTGHEKRGVE